MKKEGFKRSLAGSKIPPGLSLNAEIEKREKKKKLQKVFGSSEKISTFAVPTETKGKTKR
ncbi:hypothetical protein BV902_24795 [Sphingobacterium sp. B29]|uniref:hypothetical protein n=1 Tax=Sphingobacterium sp. B29 TaxID=1933220 RepID=UPI00095881DA|nr:hypothetical protein [Sphingobacterium sp. B29]APU96557.1 hypothetical protein BV902_09475 [Sphingobacterium sp. B29]APU99136.1 hypothetical protein BV902_24795 [Sphingobacterium sp. B29]